MPYFSGLKILIRNDRRMTHPPERDRFTKHALITCNIFTCQQRETVIIIDNY